MLYILLTFNQTLDRCRSSFSFTFKIFFLTFRCLYWVVIHRKSVFYVFYNNNTIVFTLTFIDICFKNTFSRYKLKILRLKVAKHLTNLLKKFCEFRPSVKSEFLIHLVLTSDYGKCKIIYINQLKQGKLRKKGASIITF